MTITGSLIRSTITEAEEVLKNSGVPIEHNAYTIKIVARCTIFGQIRKVSANNYELTVSRVFELIDNEEALKNELLNTITHELIHTVKNCMNHGEYFKRYASYVNKHYVNLSISRCGNMNAYGVSYKQIKAYCEKLRGVNHNRANKHLFIIRCNGCNYEWNYKSKTKAVVHAINNDHKIRCPYCKSVDFSCKIK